MYIAITEAEIEADTLAAQVLKPSDGALVTFAGVVRDHSGERRTRYLEYEAYAEMAEAVMTELASQAMARWPLGDVAIVHRTGRIEIGETSVLISVASSHRGEAFEATRFLIDRLKEVVPIWKKEVSDDGYSWVEGPVAGASVSQPGA